MTRSKSAFTANSEPVLSSPLTTERAAQVLRHFRVVFNSIKSHFQQMERQAGVGGAQVWALSIIRDNPGIGVNGLAQSMDVHQTTASNLVRSLVAAEMVAAEKNGADRRTVQLRPLANGLRVLRLAPGPFSGVLPEALGRLDTETLCRLQQDLSSLIRELNADEAAANTPLAHL
ncbi:MAG: MarR family winged helix-turn-helix transcriptional regulator [Casimicrobium sp.]